MHITQKQKWISAFVVLGILLLACAIFFVMGYLKRPDKIKIFSDFHEVIKIEEQDSNADKSWSISKDRYLSTLNYVQATSFRYKEKDLKFTLYAYVFQDASQAQAYFTNATGMDHHLEKDFFMDNDELIVIDGNRAYQIEANALFKVYRAVEFINEYFSETVITLR